MGGRAAEPCGSSANTATRRRASVGLRTRAVTLLNRLKRALLACGAVRATARVIAGRVPILTCTTAVGGFPCDVSLGVANGAAAVPLVQALLARYAPLRPLMLVLKTFLEQRSLDSPFTGGIGGYLLLSLVTALLQTLGKDSGALDLGDALTRFFVFYGREFDFRRHGISIARGGVVPKRPPRAFALAVEDPQETEKDIGAAAFNIRAVRAAFAGAAGALAGHRKAAQQMPAAPAEPAASALWAAVQADGHSRSGAAPPPPETLSVLSRVMNVSRALRRRPLPAPAAATTRAATQ